MSDAADKLAEAIRELVAVAVAEAVAGVLAKQQPDAANTPVSIALDELRSGPPTVSVEIAAQHLGVSRAYGYRMAREGSLPTIKLGRRVRVPTTALLRMLEDRESLG